MLVGVSEFFDIIPVGGYSISNYTAKMSMVGADGTIVFQDTPVSKDAGGTKFEVRIQTTAMAGQDYRLVVFVTNGANNNTSVAFDKQIKLEALV